MGGTGTDRQSKILYGLRPEEASADRPPLQAVYVPVLRILYAQAALQSLQGIPGGMSASGYKEEMIVVTTVGWKEIDWEEKEMRFGVYRKVQVSGTGKGGGVGHLYQFIGLARDHWSGAESVVYLPLRIEPQWAGTVRMCLLPRADFERMFEYVGEGLPENG